MKALNILCLDIEGGHGGSSKSLYNSIKYLNKKVINPIIICKKDGIKKDYENIGVMCLVEKNMPTFSVLRKESRNIIYAIFFIFYLWPKAFYFKKRLLKIIDQRKIDILHCNLISLYLLAFWIKRKRPKLLFSLHVRTNPVKNLTAFFQAKLVNKIFQGKIFITKNEQRNMKSLSKSNNSKDIVIYNSVESPSYKTNDSTFSKREWPINILTLANYSYPRGVDRIIEIIKSIPITERNKFRFIVAGDYKLPRFLPGKLKLLALRGKTLKDYAIREKVDKYVTFLGHTKNTKDLLKSADILIKPTRENNPWGRDIIEALAHGKAIISVGKDNTFVKTNYTGYLQKKFNENKISNWLLKVSKDKNKLLFFNKNATNVVKKLCDPEQNALKLQEFWITLYK
tara:strand:- start:323 stop:1516 length:1194 start_codon:yes stop_codon:yes gene_type:complete